MYSRSIFLTLLLASAFGSSRSSAQDSDFRKEIAGVLQTSQKGLVESIAKIVEQRLAKLEKRVAEKDARIGALEKKLAELMKKAPPEKAPPEKAPPEKAPPEKAGNGFLGVGHIEHDHGARISTVQEGSPAASAKLQAGDIIVAVNGEKVTSLTLGPAVKRHAPGAEITLAYLRGDKRLTTKAKLVDRDAFYAAREARGTEQKAGPIVLGVTVEEDGEGVFAYEVEECFTGHVAGLKKNDRITHVNGKPVKTLDEIESAVKSVVAGQRLTLRTKRGGETVDVVVVAASKKGAAKLVSREPVSVAKKAEPEKKTGPEKDAPKAPARPGGFLGVAVEPADGGLKVTLVVPDSCAAVYGIKIDDLLTKVGGKEITDVDSLLAVLRGRKAGDPLSVEIRRGDKTSKLDLVLGERDKAFKKPAAEKSEASASAAPKADEAPKASAAPKTDEAPKKPDPKPAPGTEKKRGTLGFQARETNDDHVLITRITPGAGAQKAGLEEGDVVLKIGDDEIQSFTDLYDVLKGLHAGDTVTVRVRRGDKEMDVQLTLGEPLSTALDD